MRDSSGELFRIVHSDTPVAVVIYYDPIERARLLDLVRLIAPSGREVVQSEDVRDAFSSDRFDSIVLLVPVDEAKAVDALEGRREVLADRRAPAVLFLLRDGSGERRLQDAPALVSWLRAQIVEPARLEEIDPVAERAAFERETGQPPEQWLAEWRAGRHSDTQENNSRLHTALLLENA